MGADRIIVVDWGTTAFRAWLVDAAGAVLDEIASGRGMRGIERGGFAGYCQERLAAWRTTDRSPPIYMAGMVGAAQGWVLAPQPPLPIGLDDLARQLVPADGLAEAWIVPGARCESPDGEIDVMRGEEVQIFGALALAGAVSADLCLPGTHSKWASVRDGRLESFVTHMTGEVRQLMLEHSILGKTAERDAPFDEAAFRDGMRAIGRGKGLLHAMFLVRSLALWDRLPASAAASFLTGALIADEVRAAAGDRTGDGPVLLVSGEALRRPYEIALEAHDIDCRCVSARDASLRGVREIVRIADAARR